MVIKFLPADVSPDGRGKQNIDLPAEVLEDALANTQIRNYFPETWIFVDGTTGYEYARAARGALRGGTGMNNKESLKIVYASRISDTKKTTRLNLPVPSLQRKVCN